MFLTSVIVVCGLVNAICLGLDKLPHVATRRKVHDKLADLWLTLDGTRLLKLPQLMASSTLRVVRKVFGSSWWSVRSVCITVFSSLALTMFALLIGLFVEGLDWNYVGAGLKLGIILGLNLIFDVVTVLVTFHVLSSVANSHAFVSLFLIIADICLAAALAIGCLCAAYFLAGGAAALRDDLPDVGFVELGFASTTLLPTAAYMSVLLVMVLGQLAVKMVMHYAERVTEDGPRDSWAFRILGIVVAMAGALAIAVQHFVAVWMGTPNP